MSELIYAAIEAGGTKFMCALGDAQGRLEQRVRIETRDPSGTLAEVCDWLDAALSARGVPSLGAIGVASFGPVELDRSSARHGRLLRTPKPGWSDADLLAPLGRFGVPLALDTDVNAAALAECRWGAAAGMDHLAYVTVGTGIGVGAVVAGQPLHGLLHPELGHLRPQRHRLDRFEGVCPYHGDCFEGLASGTAVAARRSRSGEALADDVLATIQADYLGQLCASIVLALSPQRIVMGGGVMQQHCLFAPLRARLQHWLGGYIDRSQLQQRVEHYVVPPALGADSGVLGGLLLALGAGPSVLP